MLCNSWLWVRVGLVTWADYGLGLGLVTWADYDYILTRQLLVKILNLVPEVQDRNSTMKSIDTGLGLG